MFDTNLHSILIDCLYLSLRTEEVRECSEYKNGLLETTEETPDFIRNFYTLKTYEGTGILVNQQSNSIENAGRFTVKQVLLLCHRRTVRIWEYLVFHFFLRV